MDKESDRREYQTKSILDNFLKANKDILNDTFGDDGMLKKVEVQTFTKE